MKMRLPVHPLASGNLLFIVANAKRFLFQFIYTKKESRIPCLLSFLCINGRICGFFIISDITRFKYPSLNVENISGVDVKLNSLVIIILVQFSLEWTSIT
jgi:hypothetical protein